MPLGLSRTRSLLAAVALGGPTACASAAPAPPRAALTEDGPAPSAWTVRAPSPAPLPPSDNAPPVSIAWAYRAGAPLAAPPAIGADGRVVVGSVDGYLHALRGDGSFSWGYTLRGPLVGRPAFGPSGDVFVAADPNGLYALDSEGTLLWVSSVSGGVRSPPVVDRTTRVWITTGQGTLLGYSARGGIVGFARVGSGHTLGPAPLASGGVAIASANGDLKIAGNQGSSPRATASPPLLSLEATEDALFVLGEDGLARFDALAQEERWSRTDVARVACASPSLVVVEHQALRWLSAQGEPQALVSVSLGGQRPIACLPDGTLLVPDDNGGLLRVSDDGVLAREKLPPGRLVSLDPTAAGLVVAGYRDGRVLAFCPPG